MAFEFYKWFKRKFPIIGVVHLLPLPGSTGFGGSIDEILERALQDAENLVKGGVDGIIVENFGDAPFPKDEIPDETVAVFTLIANEIRKIIPQDIPLGINVLRNCASQAVVIAYSIKANFIRINIPVGAFLTPSGIIEGQARKAALKRRELGAWGIGFFEDVLVKHAWPLAGKDDIEGWVRETENRGLADVIIVSGEHTGGETDPLLLKRVKKTARVPVIVGSGVNYNNVERYLKIADGAIVGTDFEKDGVPGNPVEKWRVERLMEKVSSVDGKR